MTEIQKHLRVVSFLEILKTFVDLQSAHTLTRKVTLTTKVFGKFLLMVLQTRRQSYKRNLSLINFVLDFLVVHYYNSDCNNTVVGSK